MGAARRSASKIAALCLYIIVILVATPQAQQPTSFSGSPNAITSGPAAVPPDATSIDLLVGRSTILNVGSTIARVSLTVPDVADAMVTAPQQLLIHGKTPGVISMFVWDRAGGIKTYEVNVRRDLTQLIEQMRNLFPGEPITVVGSGKDVVLSGTVASKYVIEKAAEVAAGYVEKKENVVNLLKQQEGVASNQVMLRVRFAEVSRSALQELGASFVASGYQNDWSGRTTTQQFPAPAWDQDGKLVFSDFLNLFVFNSKEGLGGVVKALQNKGLFQSLAEPNLIATNGKEASFLAGGEYPYPVVQPGNGASSVTIMFKEFGVRLNFTPTVLGGDLINLKVRPEVSSLDFSNAITLGGFRVPALSTRRTETEVELRDGQTFAIAGLMNNTLNTTMAKIPGIGDIPILGLLFQSKAHQKNQTELVVMITPTIIKRGQMGVSEGLPNLVDPYMGAPKKSLPNPAPYVGSPRYPADTTAPHAGGSDDAPAPAAAPAASAAPVRPSTKPAPKPAAEKKSPATTAPAVPSRPVSSVAAPMAPPPSVAPAAAPMPSAPPASTPSSGAAMGSPYDSAPAATPSVSPAPAKPAPANKDQAKLVEKAQQQEKKASEAEARERAAADKKKAEQGAVAQKKAEADKRQADKLAKERAEREAEIAKKNQQAAHKSSDDKKEKALVEAAARLKEAQAAYEQELQKAKGGADPTSNSTTAKTATPSSSKQ